MGNFAKRFEVVRANPHSKKKFNIGGKEIKFNGKHNLVTLTDPAVAEEMRVRYGGEKDSLRDDVRVIPVDDYPKDPEGHRYGWSQRSLSKRAPGWKQRIDWGHKKHDKDGVRRD